MQVSQSDSSATNPAGTAVQADATVGVAVHLNLASAAADGLDQWSIVTGSLAPGLKLASSGLVTGTPSTPGQWNAVVQSVNRKSGRFDTAALPVVFAVHPSALAITSKTLNKGDVGVAYTASLQASGGTPGYIWSLSDGGLPAGLSLASSGVISGTPTSATTAKFTVNLKDSGSPAQLQTKIFTLKVSASPLVIASKALNTGQLGATYTANLQASGGTPGYTWSLSEGALPPGLSLSSSGVISGTPKAAGNTSFSLAVTDSGSPAQVQTESVALAVTAPALAITSSTLGSAQAGAPYTANLQASGGTPGYIWSVKAGTLPAGLSLNDSGVIAGTPTSAGSSSFSVAVTDSSSPAQVQTVATAITVAPSTTSSYNTWYIRTDGGTRYSTNVLQGQCDGKADTAYPGTGVNQHCAFNDVRYMWMDGTYGNAAWVMSGGDTLVIRGCAALPWQQNPDAPHCRIGWDKATGNDAQNLWCAGVSSGCGMPAPPSGSASQHTRILGACAYGTYSCNPVIGYPYTNNNLTQLFGGFGASPVLNLSGSRYVDVQGLEITSHNGECTRVGAPAYPAGCSTSAPVSDFSQWGITFNNTTSDIAFQDLYIHGFTNLGLGGPIGGHFSLNRVTIAFNAFAGWNFDDGYSTPDAAGSSITQSYVTMIGNGCLEEYPIVHTKFPAKACWDSNSAGFGDSWSGQNSALDSFTCDHCQILYNTKDGAMGPHTLIHNISLTNSTWIGNMGQAGKWGQDSNATFLFQNNIVVGNCLRMSEALPGAAQNFNQSAGLTGSYLSNFCRASGDTFDFFADQGSSVNFNNNTFVSYAPTVFDLGCSTTSACSSTPYNFTNNLILGYTSPKFNSNQAPGLYYLADSSVLVAGSHNLEYGVRNGDACGTNGNICADPLLVNEPAQGSIPPETTLDNFNFHPSSGSRAIGAGKSYTGSPATDYFGVPQTSPLIIGAVEP